MNEYVNSSSLLGTFFKGAGSGAFSGGIMAGIMGGLSYVASIAIPSLGLAFAAAPLALVVTGSALFGGVMAVKRSMETKSDVREFAAPNRPSAAEEITPAVAMSQTIPSPAMAEEAEMAAAPTRSWAERTSASRPTDSIRQILDNGAMSDKDRASAILAAREASANQSPTV
jgi:hypothetical protein